MVLLSECTDVDQMCTAIELLMLAECVLLVPKAWRLGATLRPVGWTLDSAEEVPSFSRGDVTLIMSLLALLIGGKLPPYVPRFSVQEIPLTVEATSYCGREEENSCIVTW